MAFWPQPVVRIDDSEVLRNAKDGIHLTGQTNAILEGNRVLQNRENGINVLSAGSGTRIGSEDLSLGRGNRVEDNFEYGIVANGDAVVVGNTISGHVSSLHAGVSSDGALISRNVIFGNATGVYARENLVSENRIYNNTVGVSALHHVELANNVIYSNETGIVALDFLGSVHHNIIYANSSRALDISPYLVVAEVRNNTIYQPDGSGIVIDVNSGGTLLRDNIIWTCAGAAIVVPKSSQRNFDSDFNLILAMDSGSTGIWQNAARSDLPSWATASGMDKNSLALDPRFVDSDGADDQLGFVSNANDGRDDDFHLQSLFGSFHGGSFAPVRHATTGLPVF